MTVNVTEIENDSIKNGFQIQPINYNFTDWSVNYHGKTDKKSSGEKPFRRTPNATHFDPCEAPSRTRHGTDKQRQFRRLNKHHRDVYGGYRADLNLSSRADDDTKVQIMLVLGTQLEIDQSLVYSAIRRVFRVDIPKMGLPTAVVGFCIYAKLINDATDDYENRTKSLYNSPSPGKGAIYWPSSDKMDNDPYFERIASNLIEFYSNVTESVLQSIFQKLRNGGLPKRNQNEHSPPRFKEIFNS